MMFPLSHVYYYFILFYLFFGQILNELLLPKGYKLRLYCLQALNLTPMDIGIGGRPGKSDPYLKVKLGKEVRRGGEKKGGAI